MKFIYLLERLYDLLHKLQLNNTNTGLFPTKEGVPWKLFPIAYL